MCYLLYLMFRCDRRCDRCDGKFGNFVGTKHTLCRKTLSQYSQIKKWRRTKHWRKWRFCSAKLGLDMSWIFQCSFFHAPLPARKARMRPQGCQIGKWRRPSSLRLRLRSHCLWHCRMKPFCLLHATANVVEVGAAGARNVWLLPLQWTLRGP